MRSVSRISDNLMKNYLGHDLTVPSLDQYNPNFKTCQKQITQHILLDSTKKATKPRQRIFRVPKCMPTPD